MNTKEEVFFMPKKERKAKSGDEYQLWGFLCWMTGFLKFFSLLKMIQYYRKIKTWKIRTLENFLCAFIRYSKRSIKQS